eukprot:NODE_12618_length_1213_cov_6.488950.p1 GENE.NODE_12618_length_1213_cov_6.488950~~NODE_12618_length_1213_cov_6.488950.p1  ORF type:complete len:341 (-),score=108.36 NODE_12618_length_1213_cov_6.488950:112-1134(-)
MVDGLKKALDISNGTVDRLARTFHLGAGDNRTGIDCSHFPCHFDIDVEYQDWILVAVCCILTVIFFLPCLCGRLRNQCSRSFTSCVYTRLHAFFLIVVYFDLTVLMFTIFSLPDWTVDQFAWHLLLFFTWVLIHLEKMIYSCAILAGFYLLFRFKDRLLVAAGMEHVTFMRWSWRDLTGFGRRQRPIELFIWKVDDLKSATAKVLKANDVFVQCHLGNNEPMRTRVHNNAGTSCEFKESFQLNLDENSKSQTMTLQVKDQTMIASSELARVKISTREICCIEDQTGKRRMDLMYTQESFVKLSLAPRGSIWIAIAPVEDSLDLEETKVLMRDRDDDLLTC